MNYDTFKETILNHLESDIPDPKTISIQSVLKNNGLHLDGLVIMENSCNISPAIYLNYYYDSYQSGTSFQDVYDSILNSYRRNCPSQDIDVRFFTDLENVRKHIVFKLINYAQNAELLTDIPHQRFLDLAVVFYCLIPLPSHAENATILIHNSHLSYWHLTVSELSDIAKENTPQLLSPQLRSMRDVLAEMIDSLPAKSADSCYDSAYPMFVLTNQKSLYGAGCMIYPGLLQAYALEAETDFYILPSSIHEILLIPAKEENCMQELSEMVREVNETQLAPEEILSDHAYYYSSHQQTITM